MAEEAERRMTSEVGRSLVVEGLGELGFRHDDPEWLFAHVASHMANVKDLQQLRRKLRSIRGLAVTEVGGCPPMLWVGKPPSDFREPVSVDVRPGTLQRWYVGKWADWLAPCAAVDEAAHQVAQWLESGWRAVE
ncbi:hypothetical protein GCM10009678_54450 [Actinomadura kijaniata]|uniref:Uncharacterized protein n=1 Tax=Actinomadura namibiensis TaxID=182080 RepID=A0A7W3LRK8_ACTNM|nr:hypothetical protein [Actinomadura namibiensis]MBA8952922.1 hypothetical protein [Actinomadura namibiensis]